MIKSKKILALSMALLITFSLMGSLYASDSLTKDEKAKVLYDLGLFSGTSTTEFVPDLNGSANREQAAKMVSVAFGWKADDALNSQFSDVSDWAQPYVALAVANGITKGVGVDSNGNQLFGAQEPITARQLMTWFDRILTGSSSAWDDNADLDNDMGINRGELIEATYDVLSKIPVGETNSLIEMIIGDDDNLKRIAEEGRLIDQQSATTEDTDNGAPSITKINVLEKNIIELIFSEALEKVSAENISNYSLYVTKKVYDPISSVELTDVNSVKITFKDNLSGNYYIVIKGIYDLTGNEAVENAAFYVDNRDLIIKMIDVDKDNIEITFSDDLDEESAENKDHYALYDSEGEKVNKYIDLVKLTDEDKVMVKFEKNLSGTYTIRVSAVEDEDGDKLETVRKTFVID